VSKEEIDWNKTIKMADSLFIPPNMVTHMVKQGHLQPIYKEKVKEKLTVKEQK